MRFLLPLFLILGIFMASGQEENSLLWEISGNGLKERSYLYGTMHVSKRIAFRLDDVFYEALDQSDIIALESDPETWLDNTDHLGFMNYGQGNGFISKGFYTFPFTINNPRKEDIATYLAFEDRRVNNILYRTDGFSQNFEEETYLDMFIYQAGKKFGKKVIALENLEESAALVGRASLNAMKQKPDEWLQKRMQQQDPISMLQDAYRNRNISLLDSIDKAMYTEHYLKNMLFIRNRNMADQLDSIMRTGKIFTGIGAAHLPGEKGVIAMLRDMGYTVDPLVSRATAKGQRLKAKFEKSTCENTYAAQGPDDAIFSILLPNKLYPVAEHVNTTYISPDLANGSYVMVNRIPTFSHLKQEHTYSLDDIDRLLFENIPGKILHKERIKRNGFGGLDIKNQLKNGDHQRYRIYVTPLEILIFKMGGEGEYVLQHSDTIFNSISFRCPAKKKVVIDSGFKDFKIEMPSFHTFSNRFRNGDRLVQGYDSITGSYYFLRKATLNDFNFIEEDTFELKQIQKRFYQDLKLNPTYDAPKGNALRSKVVMDSLTNKALHLKTSLMQGDYYLMGVLTTSDKEAATFFDSFEIKEPTYQKPFGQVKDTAMFFSTTTTVKPPKFVENSNNYHNGRSRPKTYNAFNKKTIYQNKNNEAITVEVSKAHDFLMFPDIDSVWALRKKINADKRFIIYREKDSSFTDEHHELQLILTDTASTRSILVKNVVKNGLLYEVRTVTDIFETPSPFVTKFYENFRPSDTLIGKDILKDKTPEFFEALRNNDSILINGYRFITFGKKHIDSLKHYIATFDFPDDKKNIQAYLIQNLGKLDSPEVMPFLKRFYVSSYNNSNAQTKILQAITKKADETSVSHLLELLSKDLPLVSNKFEIQTIFKPYMDSLELAKKLYPELLDYSTIQEYKSPIFSMLAQLKAKGSVKPKSYKKYKKQMLNDAKIQLKRHLGFANNSNTNKNAYLNYRNRTKSVLEDYTVLLYPFINEKDVKEFFQKLSLVQDKKIRTTYAALLLENGQIPPNGFLDSLAADVNSRNLLFNKLKRIGKSGFFPALYRNEKSLAESIIFDKKPYNKNTDIISFMEQRPLAYRGGQYTGYYFKVRKTMDYNKNCKMHLVVFENGKDLMTKPFYKNKGLHIEDTDSDHDAMKYVTEEFLLKDRKRATIYRPNGYGGYGFNGY